MLILIQQLLHLALRCLAFRTQLQAYSREKAPLSLIFEGS